MDWKCQRSGDCCTKPTEIVMTKEEALLLRRVAPVGIVMSFGPVDDRFVAMKAGPCPFFIFNSCVVYEHRPYNCRRFACMRPDPKAEPWAFTANGDCANLWDRISTSRIARRLGQLIQRKAQRWARSHGWTDA